MANNTSTPTGIGGAIGGFLGGILGGGPGSGVSVETGSAINSVVPTFEGSARSFVLRVAEGLIGGVLIIVGIYALVAPKGTAETAAKAALL